VTFLAMDLDLCESLLVLLYEYAMSQRVRQLRCDQPFVVYTVDYDALYG